MVVKYHDLPDSVVSNCGLVFSLKFLWLLYCFLDIKRRFLTAFYTQTNGLTEMQNNTMKTCLWAFINNEQDNWSIFFLITKFANDNVKNASFGHISFELNYGYHYRTSYQKDINLCFQSKSIYELAIKVRKLMIVYREKL